MNELANFHFIRPAFLLLVPVVLALWLRLRKQNDPLATWRNVIEPELLDAMTVERPGRRVTSGLPRLVSWILAAIAIAGPTWQQQPSPFADDPLPVMIVLKAGESMKQSDLSPSRMERARLKAVDLAEARKGQPLGLVVYAGAAHLVLPPTRDSDVVATMATEISPEIMPRQGDDLAGALRLAVQTVGDPAASFVIVTDTVPAGSLPELKLFREESAAGIHILGIARPGTPEALELTEAATALRAELTMLTPDDGDVTTIVRQVTRHSSTVVTSGESTRWVESGWWLTPLVAFLVLAGFRREESAREVVS
ncbi:MAG: VWA domain-containing protein [Aureliella sp.]